MGHNFWVARVTLSSLPEGPECFFSASLANMIEHCNALHDSPKASGLKLEIYFPN